MEAVRMDAVVREDRSVFVPELEVGEHVELIVLRTEQAAKARKLDRRGGWAKGWLTLMPDFDEPIPGMEDYV